MPSRNQGLPYSRGTWNHTWRTPAYILSSPGRRAGQVLTNQVVYDVGERPDHRNAEERDAEENDVEDSHRDHVRQPDPPAVHHPRVGVHLAVCHANVHPGADKWRLPEVSSERFSQISAIPNPVRALGVAPHPRSSCSTSHAGLPMCLTPTHR